MKTAVVIAWRQGETELQDTIDSASMSIGKGAIVPVEDVTGAGPAQTRHRGIEAAKGADVVIIADAHMRFDGSVLSDMAREVRRNGGLLCAKCYHNPECSFDAKHPGGASYYAGADIHYKGEDQNGKQALVWKWSKDGKPGPRACIGGACYVFNRSWYYDTGQCLSALPAWGCDEEALSITAWLSGLQPRVFDGKVAHRWRPRPPWKTAASPLSASRAALICGIVSAGYDRDDLLAYQKAKPVISQQVERWHAALQALPRTWAQWKAEVAHIHEQAQVQKRAAPVSRANYGATENLRLCPACGSDKSTVTNTRQVGTLTFRYRTCAECGRKRVTRQD